MLLARAALRLRRAKRSLAVDAAQLEDTASQLLKRHGVAGVQAAVIDAGQVKAINQVSSLYAEYFNDHSIQTCTICPTNRTYIRG